MAAARISKLTTVGYATVFVVLMLALVVLVLSWHGYTRYSDFRTFQDAVAGEAVHGVAVDVAALVAEKARMVNVFADLHKPLLQRIATLPETRDDEFRTLSRLVAEFFPDYFAVTVIDSRGEPVIDDFEGLIGELCRSDIQSFHREGYAATRIHPNPFVYHFDVMAPWESGQHNGLLFVSFQADMLGTVVRRAQAPGHMLLLVDPSASNLIEVTADGARVNWDREDYRLQPHELRRVLHTAPVTGTRWELMDLYAPGLFAAQRERIWLQGVLVFSVFLLVSVGMLYLIRRTERRRALAEGYKDELVSVVSHELRTPLTSIMGSLGLVAGGASGKIDVKTRELIEIALSNTRRLNSIINDILDLRKIETGHMQFDMQSVPLMALVENALATNSSYAESMGVTYELVEALPGARVNADAHRIEQVMANLLSNAAKYGSQGDHIEVAVQRVPQDYLRVSVTDHGAGIPESFRNRVFRKFSQADTSSTRNIKGTGLGLSIVKAIIEEHNGQVGFVSEPGNTTTFYFDLPELSASSV
ncbi:MAG: HAMP domain-containing histidine kinase [Pseudomonadota bacterium]|nr:MAG: HAMP domain-containing histidine kinase [Pseudomonadota bacterium]